MSEPQFPPSSGPMSAKLRRTELETCKFLSVRKAVTDVYRNPDGTPLMTYQQTLDDRNKVRQTLLDFEKAQGWLIMDEGADTAPVEVKQEPVPVIQFLPATVPVQMAEVQTPSAPPQQPPPAEMVTTKARRVAKPNLGTSVAPPPMSLMPTNSAPPQPPPGAAVFVPALVQSQQTNPPFVRTGFGPGPMGDKEEKIDLSAVLMGLQAAIGKVDNLGEGLTKVSAQVNELIIRPDSKELGRIQQKLDTLTQTVDLMMAAVHHIYTSIPATVQAAASKNVNIGTVVDFKKYISSFLPQ